MIAHTWCKKRLYSISFAIEQSYIHRTKNEMKQVYITKKNLYTVVEILTAYGIPESDFKPNSLWEGQILLTLPREPIKDFIKKT